MANCGKDILLNREGTGQKQRFTDALNPDWVKLNDFGLEEWMNFAWNFARQVNYFGTENDQVSLGNWQKFFLSKKELKDFLKEVELSSEITVITSYSIHYTKLYDLQELFVKMQNADTSTKVKNLLNVNAVNFDAELKKLEDYTPLNTQTGITSNSDAFANILTNMVSLIVEIRKVEGKDKNNGP